MRSDPERSVGLLGAVSWALSVTGCCEAVSSSTVTRARPSAPASSARAASAVATTSTAGEPDSE